MIRGKKNFLPSIQLQFGFGLMFRLDEESTERRMAQLKEKQSTRMNSISTELTVEESGQLGAVNNDDEEDVTEEIELNRAGQHVEEEEEEGPEDIELDKEHVEDEEEEFPDVKVGFLFISSVSIVLPG